MHERGYLFVGPAAISRLTIPEIQQLRHGFQIEQQLQYDQEHGIRPEERDGFDEFVSNLDDDEPSSDTTPPGQQSSGQATRGAAGGGGSGRISPPGQTTRQGKNRSGRHSGASRGKRFRR